MERNDWIFHFKASEIAEAARKKQLYHANRADEWMEERDRLEKEIRGKGISLTEQQMTGHARFHAQVDSSLASKYETAVDKMETHMSRRDEYQKFKRALETSPEQIMELDVDDIKFFDL